jgi:isocitrate dehydrogenase
MSTKSVTVAYGDGIGPELMEAVLTIMRNANVPLDIETVELGQKVYQSGYSAGIADSSWESLNRTKILLKSPITTPQGGGYKSLNVTLRKALGLYANVRPCIAYHPYVPTNFPKLNIVIVRENEEDLYAGIEHRHTHNTCQTLKLITRTGCAKIIHYAFEYAKRNNRKKVSCFSKDNIMKMTDGLFHKVFNEIAKLYPDIENNHYIIDIGAARLANNPELFDVIVTSNLYGDIISDIVAEVSGSVGMAGSANVGSEFAMFEAIHGSAPDIAGKNIANPSGLLHGAIMMLVHLKLPVYATAIHNAWLRTLEDGIHTADIYDEARSTKKVGTKEFAEAIVERLGQKPSNMQPVEYKEDDDVMSDKVTPVTVISCAEKKELVGVDVYLHWNDGAVTLLAEQVNRVANGNLSLQMIDSRGLTVWPKNRGLAAQGDHWRLRFVPNTPDKVTGYYHVLYLLEALFKAGFDIVKTDNLYTFDGQLGFSLGQSE